MREKSILAVNIGAALLGLTSAAWASCPVTCWDFKAYGGFAKMHVDGSPDDRIPDPGYDVLLTPLPPRDHEDMGAFHWGELPLPGPSLLGINQKEPLIHGQSWKAPGRYYGEKKPIMPDITSIHGETIDRIETGDEKGEVIGWVTHYNNWIPKDFKDARVAVNYHLLLFDPDDDTLAWDFGEMFFFMDIWETANRPPSHCCPDGNVNDAGRNEFGCADRFRVGVLEDFNENGVIDPNDLERAPEPGSSFDVPIGTFTYPRGNGVEYNAYLTGFWEAGGTEPVGEGWSPESNFTHFEVRAEVWEAETAADPDRGREPKAVTDSLLDSSAPCTSPFEPD
jgi:hypothetical protein